MTRSGEAYARAQAAWDGVLADMYAAAHTMQKAIHAVRHHPDSYGIPCHNPRAYADLVYILPSSSATFWRPVVLSVHCKAGPPLFTLHPCSMALFNNPAYWLWLTIPTTLFACYLLLTCNYRSSVIPAYTAKTALPYSPTWTQTAHAMKTALLRSPSRA
jgi:hypothetical protein